MVIKKYEVYGEPDSDKLMEVVKCAYAIEHTAPQQLIHNMIFLSNEVTWFATRGIPYEYNIANRWG
jgi:hypothetical protein